MLKLIAENRFQDVFLLLLPCLWRSDWHMLAAQKEGEQYEQDEAGFHVFSLRFLSIYLPITWGSTDQAPRARFRKSKRRRGKAFGGRGRESSPFPSLEKRG
jgi:hypothetical protein